jgi:ATP/maltotriose-dependent transcriptional regulator MalT
LKALPSLDQSRPKLSLLQAWLLFLTGHLEEVERKLAEFEVTLGLSPAISPEIDEDESSNSDQVLGSMVGLQAQIAVIKGDLPRAIALSQQALAYLAEDERGLRGVITHNLALAYGINGEAEKPGAFGPIEARQFLT